MMLNCSTMCKIIENLYIKIYKNFEHIAQLLKYKKFIKSLFIQVTLNIFINYVLIF